MFTLNFCAAHCSSLRLYKLTNNKIIRRYFYPKHHHMSNCSKGVSMFFLTSFLFELTVAVDDGCTSCRSSQLLVSIVIHPSVDYVYSHKVLNSTHTDDFIRSQKRKWSMDNNLDNNLAWTPSCTAYISLHVLVLGDLHKKN